MKTEAYKFLARLLCLMQLAQFSPTYAMQDVQDRASTLIQPKSCISLPLEALKESKEQVFLHEVKSNEEGVVSLSFHPDLWQQDYRVILVDCLTHQPMGFIQSSPGYLNFIGSSTPVILESTQAGAPGYRITPDMKGATTLFEVPLPADENSFFNGLETSRHDVIHRLKAKCLETGEEGAKIRSLVSKAVQHNFLTGFLPWHDPQWATLAQDRSLYPTFFQAYTSRQEGALLESYCQDPYVCWDYLSWTYGTAGYSQKKPVGFETKADHLLLNAIARLQGVNLAIWEEDGKAEGLKKVISYEWDESKPYKHFLHQMNPDKENLLQLLQETVPPQIYPAVSIQTQGPLTIRDGIFTQGGQIGAPSLTMQGHLKFFSPMMLVGQNLLSLNCVLQSYADIWFKGDTLINDHRVKAKAIVLDIKEGINQSSGDFKAEEDLTVVHFTVPSPPHKATTTPSEFKKFDNYGSMGAKRFVKVFGDNYIGHPGSSVFAGIAYVFHGNSYEDAGYLSTPGLAQLMGNSLSFKEHFKFKGDRLVARASKLLSAARTATLVGHSQVSLHSDSSLFHYADTFLEKTTSGFDGYSDYYLAGNLASQEKTELPRTHRSLANSVLREEISGHQKNLTFPLPFEDVGISLYGRVLEQQGRVRSFSGPIQYKGDQLILSGFSQMTSPSQAHQLLIQGMKATLDGALENHSKTLIQILTHFDKLTHFQVESLTCLPAEAVTLKGSMETYSLIIDCLSGIKQGKTSSLKAQDALLTGGAIDLQGRNTLGQAQLKAQRSLAFGGEQTIQALYGTAKTYTRTGKLSGRDAWLTIQESVEESPRGSTYLTGTYEVEVPLYVLKSPVQAATISLKTDRIWLYDTLTGSHSVYSQANTAFNNFGGKVISGKGGTFLDLEGTYNTLGAQASLGWLTLNAPQCSDTWGWLLDSNPDLDVQGRRFVTSHSVPPLQGHKTHVPWGVGLAAPEITVKQNLSSSQALDFDSTETNLNIEGTLSAPDINLESKKDTTISKDVSASNTVRIKAGETLTARSCSITGDQLCALSATNIIFSLDVHRLGTPHGYKEYFGALSQFGSRWGKTHLQSLNDTLLIGTKVFGLKKIKMHIGGNYSNLSQPREQQETFSSKKKTTHIYDLAYHRGQLLSGKYVDPQAAAMVSEVETGTIVIEVGGDTVEQGTQTFSENFKRETKGKTTIEPANNVHDEQTFKKKRCGGLKRVLGRKKTVETRQCQSQIQRAQNYALRHIHDTSGNTMRLRAVDYYAGDTITLESKRGYIELFTAKDTSYQMTQKRSKDALWQAQSQNFRYDEAVHMCRFQTGTENGVHFITPDGVIVEHVIEKHSRADGDKDKGRPQEWHRIKDLPIGPGYEWLKLLDQREGVIRLYVDERHDSGHFAHQGMTSAAKIVASLVLTICTGGAGSILTILMNSMIINTVDQRGQVDRAAKATFSKESLKGLGAQILGQVLLSGADMLGDTLSKTATSAATQTATQAATKVVSESVTWVDRFQTALSSSLKTSMATFAAKGIVYGNWRDQLQEAGINLVTDTAAQFGAAQIGAGRTAEVDQDLRTGQPDLYNYLSHKISHAALGAATRAAQAKMSGGNRKEIRKAAKGGAIGAATAEMIVEFMMPAAVKRIQTQLQQERLSPGNSAYDNRRQELLRAELKDLKLYGEMAAVVTAQSIGGNIEAAQMAARNALEFNSRQVFEEVLQNTDPNDLFTEIVEDKLKESKKEREEDKNTQQEAWSFQERLEDKKLNDLWSLLSADSPSQGGESPSWFYKMMVFLEKCSERKEEIDNFEKENPVISDALKTNREDWDFWDCVAYSIGASHEIEQMGTESLPKVIGWMVEGVAKDLGAEEKTAEELGENIQDILNFRRRFKGATNNARNYGNKALKLPPPSVTTRNKMTQSTEKN
ncbi:MAG: hemagglutinin repeat-containing protein [Candidatus Paracaedibacteraceae bacterium]|nr:hemagglutinin repeat-containing protein [Candidatus Paracaedibacteraceae bacterium]